MTLRFIPPLPRSLRGQVLLSLAAALLLAQGIGATLLYKAQSEYRQEQLIHSLALRLTLAIRHDDGSDARGGPDGGPDGSAPADGNAPPAPAPAPAPAAAPRGKGESHDAGPPPHHLPPLLGERGGERGEPDLRPGPDDLPHGPRPEHATSFTPLAVDTPQPRMAERLGQLLAEQDITLHTLKVVRRPFTADAPSVARMNRRMPFMRKHHIPMPENVLVAAYQRQPGAPWLIARVGIPPRDPWLLATLIAQTLLIYATLVGAMALILRRIVRPLAALTDRLEHFAENREADGQLEPQGPQDVCRLIEAHNAMENRIIALLNEKDVMLGAIGHDLKTPLAALRVRIECVDDDAERDKMAKTIEDIVRSLDDILSLARVGRPSDPLETSELSALVASVVEEFEDMGEEVVLGDTVRLVLPLRSTWLRRALRNLVGNALRYAGAATVTTLRESIGGRDWATIRICDEGPGIPDEHIQRMFEPFTRGEPSRNSATGGTGLGLTLARAIAQQHGGSLELVNRTGPEGQVTGLLATLRLPLP